MLIAHLSDTHLTSTGIASDIARTSEALQRAVDYLNSLSPAPDAVVITGDIADSGEEKAYADCARALEKLNAPVWLLPGNHDHRNRMRGAFPDHTYMSDPIHGDRIQFCDESHPVRLIGLDTLCPGYRGGELNDQTLDWLNAILYDGKPSMIFMHHPPFPVGIRSMDAAVFHGKGRFRSILQAHDNVLRLCCGHMHRPALHTFGHTTSCIAPSVGMQLHLNLTTDAPPHFMMEPAGVALHYLPSENAETLVTHFAVLPEKTFTGPHPFLDAVLPT